MGYANRPELTSSIASAGSSPPRPLRHVAAGLDGGRPGEGKDTGELGDWQDNLGRLRFLANIGGAGTALAVAAVAFVVAVVVLPTPVPVAFFGSRCFR